jgi:hypothetical protein
MKVAVAYCYPLLQVRKYFPAAKLFAETFQKFPPEHEHELYVLCNGREPSSNEKAVFNSLPAIFMQYDNSGWDIGAFQRCADIVVCDLRVCLGAHVHFYRSGWLSKMVDSLLDNGPGLFGCAAYLNPDWHVRTTSFWCPPELVRSYPSYVGSSRASRYEFEHGPTSFTRHVLKLGFPCTVVTWKGCFPFDQWHEHAPDRNSILVRDQHIHV